MIENDNEFNFKIIHPKTSLLKDDIEQQILSPLSCLREFGTSWLLEFDLPLVNKRDIKITFDENSVSIEARLKEIYSEEKFGVKTKFEFFKKTITLPGKINTRKAYAKFSKGRLSITIPKTVNGHRIKVE